MTKRIILFLSVAAMSALLSGCLVLGAVGTAAELAVDTVETAVDIVL